MLSPWKKDWHENTGLSNRVMVSSVHIIRKSSLSKPEDLGKPQIDVKGRHWRYIGSWKKHIETHIVLFGVQVALETARFGIL